MIFRQSRIQIAFVLTIFCVIQDVSVTRIENGSFPSEFFFGAASSAMQVEGAWDVDGRGPSIWDKFTHEHPEKILDGRNTNDTADSYYFYAEDIKAIKSMGVS